MIMKERKDIKMDWTSDACSNGVRLRGQTCNATANSSEGLSGEHSTYTVTHTSARDQLRWNHLYQSIVDHPRSQEGISEDCCPVHVKEL